MRMFMVTIISPEGFIRRVKTARDVSISRTTKA